MKYPIYVEYGLGVHKIEDAETFVKAEDDEWGMGILRQEQAGNLIKNILQRGNKVSEAAFNNAFQRALSKLNEIASEQVGVEDWTMEQGKIKL